MSQTFDLSAVLGVPELSEYLKRVERCIDTTIKTDESPLTPAVLRLTSARGKRLRSALVIASALLSGKALDEGVIKAAAAAELVHIGSLVHDDIIDEATRRWGIPTINAQEGVNDAILAGDYLFSKACQLAAEADQRAGVLAARTIAALSVGQAVETAFNYNKARTKTDLEKAIYGKTAALLSAACQLGGMTSGQDENQLTALSYFGEDFGMSFQLVDDVLDFVSSNTLLGKPVGNDVKEGVYTLPVILSLNGSKRSAVAGELDKKTAASQTLIKLLFNNGSIEKTIAKADEYGHAAYDVLTAEYAEAADGLARLPASYIDWALGNLVAPKYRMRLKRLA